MNKKNLIVPFLAVLFFSACQKENTTLVTIQGKVENAYPESSKIIVSIKGNGVNETTEVNNDGSYAFANLPAQQDYQIIVNQADSKPLIGFSTFDIVLFSKTILSSSSTLNTAQKVAADMDSSGVLDNTDITLMRSAMLGIDAKVPDLGFFRFITPDFIFGTNKINVYDLKAVNQDTTVPTFKAVKIGILD